MRHNKHLRRAWIRIMLSAVTLVCVVAFVPPLAAATAHRHPHASGHARHSLAAERARALAATSGRFALLRRPAGAPLPPRFAAAVAHAPASYGLQPQGARSNAAGVWLIPGSGGMCIAITDTEGVGMTCNTLAAAEGGELVFSVREQSTGEERLVGAGPDGARSVKAFDAQGAQLAGATVSESTWEMNAPNVARIALE